MNLIEIKIAKIDELQLAIDSYSDAIKELALQLTNSRGATRTPDTIEYIRDNITAQKLLRKGRAKLLKAQVKLLDSIAKL